MNKLQAFTKFHEKYPDLTKLKVLGSKDLISIVTEIERIKQMPYPYPEEWKFDYTGIRQIMRGPAPGGYQHYDEWHSSYWPIRESAIKEEANRTIEDSILSLEVTAKRKREDIQKLEAFNSLNTLPPIEFCNLIKRLQDEIEAIERTIETFKKLIS